jgi:hypothetical protein
MKHSDQRFDRRRLLAALWTAAALLVFPADAFADGKAAGTELGRAKAEVDRMFDYLRKNPSADWETVRDRLAPAARKLDSDRLSPADLEALDRYVRETGEDLRPRLTSFGRQLPQSAFASGGTCYSFCIIFFQFECGTDRPFGGCFGAWGCEDGLGAHICLEEAGGDIGNDSSCSSDSDCPPGYGCATWAFKPNECVKKCDDNSDCPSGQKCKKPIGTSFKRCK